MPHYELINVPPGFEAIFLAGYRATSIEDCPFHGDNDGVMVWNYGYHQHQRDRERITELASVIHCADPLGLAKYISDFE